jgi:maltooligosyltrehalose trehalohydrolase
LSRVGRVRAAELGANVSGRAGASFLVWAPRCASVGVKLLKDGSRIFPMERTDDGYFRAWVDGASAGDLYFYNLDGTEDRPDPASRFQPEGVHGPSCIVDPAAFRWRDKGWKGIPLSRAIFYELHVGTFTPEGTFEAAVAKIPYLKELGVTVVEIMPVAQFPGTRNWGYDGADLYAVQNSYGGPEAFRTLVNACHRAGLAVCLDVVYNHFGPEGNYLHRYGPYFTPKYRTPWGEAINYDDAESDHVRRFVIDNGLRWVTEYHIDALRLDAVHGIFDFGATHILEEMNEKVRERARELGRRVHVIAESDLNDSRLIRPREQGGYGLDAQWSDDFHHAVHVCLTGERTGYYADFRGAPDIAKALRDGFVYDGKYSPFRRRRHGDSVADLDSRRLVVCVQNHDQVGNRALGERLSALTDFRRQKLAAVLLLLSPNTPLVFMGQEYGETRPFLYFIEHGDPSLVRAVREGRMKEFDSFGWSEIPDPGAKRTFAASKLGWPDLALGESGFLWTLHRDLIRMRKRFLRSGRTVLVGSGAQGRWISWRHGPPDDLGLCVVVSLLERVQEIRPPFGGRSFSEVLNTENPRYGGRSRRVETSGKRLRMPPLCAWVGRAAGRAGRRPSSP